MQTPATAYAQGARSAFLTTHEAAAGMEWKRASASPPAMQIEDLRSGHAKQLE